MKSFEATNNSRVSALIQETTLLYKIGYACDTRNYQYLKTLEQELKQLRALYPNHSSLQLMQEWIDESKTEMGLLSC